MVAADAVVLLPAERLELPKCVKAVLVVRCTQGVDEAKAEQLAKFRARLRQKKGVVDPLFRLRRVARFRDDVGVGSQDERLLQSEKLFGVDDEPIHESELVR